MAGNLKRLLNKFKNGRELTYKDGDWSISVGGYDLWFELYYQRQPKIQCIAGTIEVGNDDGIDKKKCLQVIKEVFPSYQIRKEDLDEEDATPIDLDKVVKIIELMDKIKLISNKIDVFNNAISEKIGGSIIDVAITQPNSQEIINEALRDCFYLEEISIDAVAYDKSLRVYQENREKHPNNCSPTNLDELIDCLDVYYHNIPEYFLDLLDRTSIEELGCNKFYNELPIDMIKPFIEMFDNIETDYMIRQPKENQYFVSPYDLNDEFSVFFAEKNDACSFAGRVAPATVMVRTDRGWEEVACY